VDETKPCTWRGLVSAKPGQVKKENNAERRKTVGSRKRFDTTGFVRGKRHKNIVAV